MSSTFFGLEIARSGLAASQMALNVVGQNMSNINTDGYTRQSADLVSVNHSVGKSKLALVQALNLGQGVTVDRISQIRDEFLDISYRNANASDSKWNTELSALNDVENIFDPTNGLTSVLTKFYDQLDDLSNNVDSVEYYNLARSGALVITQVLNQYSLQLSQIKNEQLSSMKIGTDDLNTTINKINELNLMLKDQNIRGNVSNELLDMRNTYIDKVSGYMNISVKDNNDGTISITSTDGLDVLNTTFSIDSSGSQVQIDAIDKTDGSSQSFSPSEGSLSGFLNILNGKGSYADPGENDFSGLQYYQTALDNFANAFAGTFNDLNSVSGVANLFSGTTASTITLSNEWFTDAKYLVVSDQGTNDNITKMRNAMNDPIDSSYSGVSGTFEEFSIMISSNIELQVRYQKDMSGMYDSILETAYNDRENVMGVSENEETINMTKYQKAFQAAARFMTVMDETLDVLINKTGVVGR